jgi:adenylate cyclase
LFCGAVKRFNAFCFLADWIVAAPISFLGWTVDSDKATLIGPAGEAVLRPKSFDVLVYLARNPGRLISRSDLLDAIWPSVTVSEDSLTQCISEIRTVTGDSKQEIVKTVPKRGYMFCAAPVGAAEFESSLTTGRSVQPTPSHSKGPVLCVLPFVNASGDTAQDYLCDGITDDILDGLSHFSDLSIIARSSSFSYKGRSQDVREVGRQLGANYVVDGSVRRQGERLRITIQLVDAESGLQCWSEKLDRKTGDIFALQDEITLSIVRIVMSHLGRAESERASRKPANTWTAYDLLTKGEQLLLRHEQTWKPEFLFEARKCFEEALKADPENARITANLGHSYSRAFTDPMIEDLGKPDVLERGHELLLEAVRLDPNLPKARALLGWTLLWWRQPAAALREFEHAMSINSNFWDWRYANTLIYANKPLEALDAVIIHKRLDPFYPPVVHAFQGHAKFMLGQYNEAAELLRESMDRAPQVLLSHVWLAAALVRAGKQDEAKSLIANVRKVAPRMTLDRWHGPRLYVDPEQSENMINALRQAGLP